MQVETMWFNVPADDLAKAMQTVCSIALMVDDWERDSPLAVVVYTYHWTGPKLEDISPVSLRHHFGPTHPVRHVIEARVHMGKNDTHAIGCSSLGSRVSISAIQSLESQGTPMLVSMMLPGKHNIEDERYIRWKRVW